VKHFSTGYWYYVLNPQMVYHHFPYWNCYKLGSRTWIPSRTTTGLQEASGSLTTRPRPLALNSGGRQLCWWDMELCFKEIVNLPIIRRSWNRGRGSSAEDRAEDRVGFEENYYNVKLGLIIPAVLINPLCPKENCNLKFKKGGPPGLINRLAGTWLINPLCWNPIFYPKFLIKIITCTHAQTRSVRF
jgi:hypothetical protein